MIVPVELLCNYKQHNHLPSYLKCIAEPDTSGIEKRCPDIEH